MKATKFLLLLWALALGSTVGWAQSVTQPTIKLSNPSGSDATDVAVCPGGGTVALSYTSSGGTVQLELRANTITGPLVNTFGTAGIISPAPMGAVVDLPVLLPALTAGNTYHLIVNVTSGMLSETKSVTIIPVALPTSPAFTLTPSTVCVQPGNASIATAVSPDTDKFGYTWSLVEGAPSTVSTFAPATGVTTTITPTAAFGSATITLTVAHRSMSCGTTATSQTLNTVAAIVPKINSTGGAPAGITVDNPADIFTGGIPAAPYATFPTVPVANKEVCEGTQITFSAYCIPGQTAVWSRNNVQIGTGSPITVTPVSGGMDPAYNEFTYTVRCKLDGSINCESEARSITVKTIRQSSLLTGTPSLTASSICQSTAGNPTTTTFTASVNCPAGSTAQWYDASSGGVPVTTGPSRTHTGVDISVAGPQTWYVTCKQGLCESASRTPYTFTVTAKPGQPTITNTNGDVACANTASGPIPGPTSLILTALCAPGTTANWYVVSTTSGFPVTTPTNDPTVGIVGTGGSYTHASAAGETTYQVRCKDNTTGCWSELSAPRTITINPVAATPAGTFVWGPTGTQICMSSTPASPDLTSLTCAPGTTVKWYNAAGTAVVSAPSNLDISGAANPGPNPDGTLVTTFTYQVACEDATADPAAMNTCESPKRTVSITVVRAPAAPTMTLDLNKTVAGTDGSVANNMNICQGPNNETVIVSNCPTTSGWTTEWQIVGSIATKGTGANWATDAPQTEGSANNTLLVNASNFNPANTSAAFGWTIRVRCNNANIPAGCATGAITEYTNVVVRQKENPQTFQMEVPAGTAIPSGKNLCLGTTIKLVQTTAPGNLCTGTLQWRRRFKSTVGGSFGAWSIVIDEQTSTIPYTNTPDAAGVYEYEIRCNGLCPGDWGDNQSVVVSETPAPGFTASPLTTICVEPNATQDITLTLTGCDASNSNGGSVFSHVYRVTRVMTEEGVVGSTSTTFDVAASTLNTITASANNSKTRTYVYTVTCVKVYGPGGPTNSVECISAPVTQTVTIRTKPAPPTALAVDATPICQGQSANLSGTCAEGTIEWFNITDNVLLGTGSPISTGVLNASHSYKARCVVPDCNGNYSAIQVSVSVVVPVKPVLSQTTPVLCPTPSLAPSVKTTTLTATGCSGSQENVVWSGPGITNANKGGAGSGMNYALTVTTGTPSVSEAGISSTGGEYVFTATCTRPGGCVSTETITVTVLPDPGLSITKLPASNPVCAGTAVTLTATSVLSPIGGWSWTGSGTLVTPGNQNDPSITTPGSGATAAMSGTYGLTANYQSCVFQAASVTLTVVTSINAPTAIVGPTTDQCQAVSATANLSTTCTTPGSTPLWSTGATTTSIAAPVPASGSATFSVKCVLGACESSSVSFTINTKPFQVTISDIKGSGVSTIAAMKSVYPFDASTYAGATHVGQLDLDKTTAVNRLGLQNYKTPRFWTLEAKLCAANPDVKSLTFRADKLDAVDNVEAQFYTTEDNDRYFMFGNGGNTPADQVYTINHPYFAFYNGGLYDAGFPKGKYNIRIDAWMVAGDTQGGTLLSNVQKKAPWNPAHMNAPQSPIAGLSRTYYIDITTTDGSARVGVDSEEAFAVVTPNPVTRTLTLSINGAKGQNVSLNLVDASGRSLMTRSVTPESNSHREEVDMSNNKTGMYFMQVTSPSKNAALKVLKVSQD